MFNSSKFVFLSFDELFFCWVTAENILTPGSSLWLCICLWTCICLNIFVFLYFVFVSDYDYEGADQIVGLGDCDCHQSGLCVFVTGLFPYSPPHHPTMCWWGRRWLWEMKLEDTFENAHWRKSKEIVGLFPSSPHHPTMWWKSWWWFEETFENAQWRKVIQIQLCAGEADDEKEDCQTVQKALI